MQADISTHEQRTDSERYNQRNEKSLKIKRIKNGYMVSSLDEQPSAYPELGEICLPSGDIPTTVGEHIYVFFEELHWQEVSQCWGYNT